jgi:hypothetical protein
MQAPSFPRPTHGNRVSASIPLPSACVQGSYLASVYLVLWYKRFSISPLMAVGRPCRFLYWLLCLSLNFFSHHNWPPCGASTTLRATIYFQFQYVMDSPPSYTREERVLETIRILSKLHLHSVQWLHNLLLIYRVEARKTACHTSRSHTRTYS